MIGVSQRSGTIKAVHFALLYLIFDKLRRWLALLGRTTPSKDMSCSCCATTIGRQRAAQST